MKRFRETVMSEKAPEDKNVLWLDISDEKYVFRLYINGVWVAITDGKNQPDALTSEVYIGSTNKKFRLDRDSIHLFKPSAVTPTISKYNKDYFYIITPTYIFVDSVKTDNSEEIFDLFTKLGTTTDEGVRYNVYELNLPSILDINLNIAFSQ